MSQKARLWLSVCISPYVLPPKLPIRFRINLVLMIYTRGNFINLILVRICKICTRRQDNVIGIVTRQWAGRPRRSGMIIGRVNKLASSPKTPIQVLGPTQPTTLFLGVKWVKLKTRLHQVPKLRTSGATHLLPHIPSWSAQ